MAIIYFLPDTELSIPSQLKCNNSTLYFVIKIQRFIYVYKTKKKNVQH